MHKLSTHQLKSGEVIQLFTGELGGSPAMPLFLKTQAEAVERAVASPYLLFKNSNKLVWAELAEEVVGGITFDLHLNEGQKLIQILFGFTAPQHRKKGIYTYCHAAVEQLAIAAGAERLTGISHLANIECLYALTKVGIRPNFFWFHKFLTEPN